MKINLEQHIMEMTHRVKDRKKDQNIIVLTEN